MRIALDAGPFWRPLEDFASDEKEQQKLYWQDERIVAGQATLTPAERRVAALFADAPPNVVRPRGW